ncbi:BMP family ABC transporter substrate-binding protein [Megalodesulfovibrio gigas]|uniref:Putative basic membrane lipoprotein n=1 Tax=Megalodesulfovibrio gigas (strain ATCC 19364 / DSM 1382 / NCIMB 9332 / VKM B-1759) TaxID=1121448 RepID=T2GD44_MEGG1|nr:BMP family ABC transporter substrate-binding protein [Megalodesulfovibrio gigas]AGW14223.1 putative basic membrane lipoprotein [Megalodesulfovibrio gigas DSM 1382 = ATCC 19364]
MNIRLVVSVVLAGMLLMASCSDTPETPSPPKSPAAAPSAAPPAPGGAAHKVCLAISSDGLGDSGYNDMQYAALVAGRARHEFVMDITTLQDNQPDPAGLALGQLLERNCTVVIAGQGWSMLAAVERLAPQHPQVRFFVVDATPAVFAPNVAGSRFHVEEAAFQAGYLAAAVSTTKALASVGGAAAPAVLDFIQGFEAGAIYQNPRCALHRIFLSEANPEANPWNSPAKAQAVAQALAREHKVDVLFAVAGGSNTGVFRAATEGGLRAVGVDTDQDHLAKGVILTSVMKRVDVALENVLDAIMSNTFENKQYSFSLRNGGVGLSPMTYTRAALPPKLPAELDEIRRRIIAGDILVPASQ